MKRYVALLVLVSSFSSMAICPNLSGLYRNCGFAKSLDGIRTQHEADDIDLSFKNISIDYSINARGKDLYYVSTDDHGGYYIADGVTKTTGDSTSTNSDTVSCTGSELVIAHSSKQMIGVDHSEFKSTTRISKIGNHLVIKLIEKKLMIVCDR